MKRNNNSGFTLVELCVSLILLCLLGFIGVSSYSEAMGNRELSRTASRIYFLIGHYQSLSLITGRDHYLRFEANDSAFYVSDEVVESEKKYVFPLRIKIEKASFGNVEKNKNILRLGKNGVASPGSVLLRRESGGPQCIVVVSLRGMRRVRCV